MREFIFHAQTSATVLVRRIRGVKCSRCQGKVAAGVKEESTGWKVYAICDSSGTECPTVRVGTVSRAAVSNRDDVAEQAEELVRQRS